MNHQNRIVLFPSGHVKDLKMRERCDALLLRCGADLGRVFDAPIVTFDRYVNHIGRINDVRCGTTPPIVVITKTNALVLNVINLRRKLSNAITNLQRSVWIVFVDPEANPFFENEARNIGSFDDELDRAPVWKEEIGGEQYLVFTPETEAGDLIPQRIAKLLSPARFQPSRRVSATFRMPSSREKP